MTEPKIHRRLPLDMLVFIIARKGVSIDRKDSGMRKETSRYLWFTERISQMMSWSFTCTNAVMLLVIKINLTPSV